MPSLLCRCGYVHNLSPIPDDGYRVLPDWATDKLLYPLETTETWETEELHRTEVTRLYVCPNCEAIMWDRGGGGFSHTYLPSDDVIRVFADLDDRDPLGGVWLRHPRTLADIEAQRLLVHRGVCFVVHNDREEVLASMDWAVDETESEVPDAWVARPYGEYKPVGSRPSGVYGR
jgi:hypothetical protein